VAHGKSSFAVKVMGCARGQLSPPPGVPVVVGDGVARHLKEPGDEPLAALHGVGVPVDAQEDLLEDVVRVCGTVHAASDEGSQAVAKLCPDLLGVAS
jgi:hypothetical protein